MFEPIYEQDQGTLVSDAHEPVALCVLDAHSQLTGNLRHWRSDVDSQLLADARGDHADAEAFLAGAQRLANGLERLQ